MSIALTKLKPRDKKFCLIYMKNGRIGAHAAKEAGFSGDGAMAAMRLLRKPTVQEFLARYEKKVEAKIIKDIEVSVDWKIGKLKQCIDACLRVDPETGEQKLYSAQGFIGAMSELNKMQGHYAPEKTLNAHFVGSTEQQEVEQLVKQYDKEY